MTDKKSNPTTLYFSLLREQWPANAQLNNALIVETQNNIEKPVQVLHSTLFVQSGVLKTIETSLTAGTGAYVTPNTYTTNNANEPATALRFAISKHAITTDQVVFYSDTTKDVSTASVSIKPLICQAFETDMQDAVLRLDQVDFPPGAIAYRHTHPGAGIRYLLEGGLQLESDHGTQHFHSGDAWFEDQNSPVRATAIDSEPSRFIRAMLLPLSFEGQPTLTLLNAEDADKPRLQTNTRHNEHRVSIDLLC